MVERSGLVTSQSMNHARDHEDDAGTEPELFNPDTDFPDGQKLSK